ncbi:MAG: RnfABCDGE type electron transport complex subunit D [Spirochaetales bacterium]|nr:RnfABCDGE type electron transport complex subunit D [Spirochaetales bacterium]
MEELKHVRIASSPHLHEGSTTARIMISVIVCLLPAGVWGVLIFGVHSLYVLFASVAGAVLTEFVIARLLGRFTLNDWSAVLTGLLVGYNMPPSVPLYIPVIASAFAIAVVKMTFGGLGRNWMNPALAGRVFVTFSWTGFMTTWKPPLSWGSDATTTATVLGAVKSGLADVQGAIRGPMEFLAQAGYPTSGMGTAAQGGVAAVFAPIARLFPPGYGDLFVGNIPGCIGEVSALLLILGSVYLFVKKIITWEIPVAYLGTFGVLIWVFAGRRFGAGFFSGDVLFHLFAGGLMLGALYMATDMVTSPLTRRGMLLYGVGTGFLTFLIRVYGSYPEGVSLAIIIMNMFVPMINRATAPVKFGFVKEGRS